MSKHRSTHTTASRKQTRKPGERLHAALLAALAALCVARPLLPSEAVSWQGDGQPLCMLWLCLAVVTTLAAVGQGGLKARWTPTDVAVLVLCGCYASSALHALGTAAPRPAMNMLWEWTSLGLVYFLTRELVRTAAESRALVAVAIALAVVLAAYGFYQYFVSMPADRSQYAQDPDAMLRESGQWYAPDSAERQQFENRLRSTEPMATFALTNSLAGYLAPWLLVTLGIGASFWTSKLTSAARARLTLAAADFTVGFCLMLTKSRSAWIAAGLGGVLLALTMPAVRERLRWRSVLGLAAVVGLLVGGAIAVRGLDRAVLSEAGKSLGYRLEYWQSTWAMIHDHPWFGCGPGNFQDAYMRYKLPQASEEIQDPHNLFFELWGSAGTPTFLALVAVLGCFAWQILRPAEPHEPEPADEHSSAAIGTAARDAASIGTISLGAVALPIGAALGFFLAHFFGPLVGLQLDAAHVWAGIALGALVVVGLWPWVRAGRLPAAVAPLAVVVLVVHLSAAGGISFPGVAYSLWILMAIAVNQTRGAQSPADEARSSAVPWASMLAMALSGVGATACYLTAYQPMLRSTAAMYRVSTDEERRDWRHYEAALLEASAADPLSAQPWQLLAGLDFQRIGNRGEGDTARQQFDRAVRTMLRLRPQSSGAYRQAGEWMLKLFRRSEDPADARLALEYYGQAVELYPNSALAHADLALALAATGKPGQARQEAEQARQLDAAMPHADKKLPADVERQLQAVENPAQ